MTLKKINRLLIANRGEIACRIMRTAKQLGITTIAVYSEADKQALHVKLADESYCIGPALASQSYLNIEALVQAAISTSADAVHPGYGFLSENAEFAQALSDKGIVFVGPSPAAIALMGDKRCAKVAMIEAGVPTLPGYSGDDQSQENLVQQAKTMGYPVMVKAAAGGGGRGMRLVTQEDQLHAAINSARSEAQNAFGNGELLLERALTKPRHIEVQIFADQQGNAVYLGERDCSIQRRHQKVVEEAPAPNIDTKTRKALGEAALLAAKSCDYIGAGTVEFLLDEDGKFYFLEMNTRLQVEHPVTEEVFGVDLVAWQIAVAEGKSLPKSQTDLTAKGHAIEVRLYAENPNLNFLPQTGTVTRWAANLQPNARIDHMLFEGYEVGNWYDPMLAKIIAWGEDREQAVANLVRQIDHTTLLGLGHNLGYLRTIIDHSAFRSAQLHTGFLAQNGLNEYSLAQAQDSALITANLVNLLKDRENNLLFRRLSHLSQPQHMQWHIQGDLIETRIDSRQWKQGILMIDIIKKDQEMQQFQISNLDITPQEIGFQSNHKTINASYFLSASRSSNRYDIQIDGNPFTVTSVDPLVSATSQSQSGNCNAPMDGMVVDILVENGSEVKSGDTLLILEGMKMEMPIKAQQSGIVNLACSKGEQVKQGSQLAAVQSTTDEA